MSKYGTYSKRGALLPAFTSSFHIVFCWLFVHFAESAQYPFLQ